MSATRMENRPGYTIVGPMSEAIHLPIRLSKSQSVRREPKLSGNNLRSLYQNPASAANHRASLSSTENGALGQATPVLPPTPPNVDDETQDYSEEPSSASDAAKIRSILATPVHQISPPTPDNTPPRQQPRMRPFLGTQPSLASSHAESFKTAREEIPSDQDSDSSIPISRPRNNRSLQGLPTPFTNGTHKPSPLAYAQATGINYASKDSSPVIPSSAAIPSIPGTRLLDHGHFNPVDGLDVGEHNAREEEVLCESIDSPERLRSVEPQNRPTNSHVSNSIPRGRSLRDRLEESRQIPHSPSVDKFASIIGWNNGVQNSTTDSRRWSGVSNTSTVEAILIEKPRAQKRRNTLRHVSKNESLRSVSSPLPKSNTTSLQSTPEVSHRLVHKTAKLENRHRFSFDSEMSQPASVGSIVAPKYEVIKVAIIPERSSSLQRSSTSSRRQSNSNVTAPTSFRMPRTSESQQRKRAFSESTERGRSRHYPPQVPPRHSSLSAPTSRNTSRANSITSDNFHFERKKAEKDLRSTLDRMETDKLLSGLQNTGTSNDNAVQPSSSAEPISDIQGPILSNDTEPRLADLTPGTKEWADLRPPSILHTPFSQPSFMSASPEISEARLISVSVHNNHSVQLIEPSVITESQAVREARNHHPTSESPSLNVDSPLRNPRRPPTPPRLQFIPSTPQDDGQLVFGDGPVSNEDGREAVQRPNIPSRDDSFAKTLLRNVSLKNARNKKADQELDSTLHPFWRPRAFWDDIDPASTETKKAIENSERGLIHNSLGLPQERLVVTGPLGLIRRLSERRRHRKTVVKQSSHSSLHRLRVAKRLYRIPGLGVNVPLMSPREIQERMHMARRRREEEKREKRREELRGKIGANVVVTGDSRFLKTTVSEDIAMNA